MTGSTDEEAFEDGAKDEATGKNRAT